MEDIDVSTTCFICNTILRHPGEKAAKTKKPIRVKRIGIANLQRASLLRNDGFAKMLGTLNSIEVHKSCRALYINDNCIEYSMKQQKIPVKKRLSSLRLTRDDFLPPKSAPDQDNLSKNTSKNQQVDKNSTESYSWDTHCYLCGENAIREHRKNKDGTKWVRNVILDSVRDKVLDAIKDREDDYCTKLRIRLSDITSLVALKAVYHAKCYDAIRLLKRKKVSQLKGESKVNIAMKSIFEYMEKNEDSEFTYEDLTSCCTGYAPDHWTIRNKLIERYKNGLLITNSVGSKPTTFELLFSQQKVTNDDESGETV